MNRIRKWLLDIFSEDDNMTVCVAKVLAVLSIFAFIGYAIYGLVAHDHFTLAEFGTGLMTVLGGSGAIIGAKQATQKTPPP